MRTDLAQRNTHRPAPTGGCRTAATHSRVPARYEPEQRAHSECGGVVNSTGCKYPHCLSIFVRTDNFGKNRQTSTFSWFVRADNYGKNDIQMHTRQHFLGLSVRTTLVKNDKRHHFLGLSVWTTLVKNDIQMCKMANVQNDSHIFTRTVRTYNLFSLFVTRAR